jgi:hypothetical protein
MPESDAKTSAPDPVRKLSRNETHDLSMIIKDRAKVLKAHIEEQAAAHLADFEQHISTVYKFDQDDVWREAAEKAQAVVAEANKKIMDQCKKLGIPAAFAPGITITWHGRGQNMMEQRRHELRLAAKARIEQMKRNAATRIEQQSLDLRTQVVAMGIVSPDAKLFLESLAPVAEAMGALDFKKIEAEIEKRDDNRRKQLPYRPEY